jgi:hypothetical protein
MTEHQKIDGLPKLDRRSFIVGTVASGLVVGYAAKARLLPLQAISSRRRGMPSVTTAK